MSSSYEQSVFEGKDEKVLFQLPLLVGYSLADSGFDSQDTLGCIMAQVKMPAFTRGKSQPAPVDLETTRKIAPVRIHVER